MPRNPSGVYTLPAGNPVVSGTPISSGVQNVTMSDVANSLTDSLSRSGLGGMQVPLQFADGVAGAPSITFTNEITTGIYRPAAGQLGISILGVGVLGVAAVGVYSEQPYYQLVNAVYSKMTNEAGDFVITGQWGFTYNGTTFKGPQVVGKGGMLFNDGATETSGRVQIVTVAPVPGTGKPGDIWLVV